MILEITQYPNLNFIEASGAEKLQWKPSRGLYKPQSCDLIFCSQLELREDGPTFSIRNKNIEHDSDKNLMKGIIIFISLSSRQLQCVPCESHALGPFSSNTFLLYV